MKVRLLKLRRSLGLNQEDFGERIGLSKASISALESGLRNITDRHVMLITSNFGVNEDWLRTGEGEMFLKSDTFSLDEYARKNNLSQLEIDIIKSYMEVDKDIRKGILTHFKNIFAAHFESAATQVDPIQEELNAYEKELLAEKKGQTSLALDEQGEEKTS